MTSKKAAIMTDIHFGRRSNSEEHNQDCLNFISWFCKQVKSDPSIDHIWFLGDWHEHRSAINAFTLQHSYNGAKMLNDLGLPIYWIVGNHDMPQSNKRETYTTEIFEPFENIHLINEIKIIEEIHGKVLAIPFIVEEDYPKLLEYANIPVAMGHLELQGFMLTGTNDFLEHGPKASDFFKKQKRVFSGHFHSRSSKDNIFYIGSVFPMNFSDANDNERGMAIYDFVNDDLRYIDWADCPKYIKTTLSELSKNHKKILLPNARVKVLVDQDITLSEGNELREMFTEKYKLREIKLEESIEIRADLSDIEQEVESLKLESTGQVVSELLKRIRTDQIDNDLLLELYKEL